jgi:transcriptional regulator with XRE-family HTH domain
MKNNLELQREIGKRVKELRTNKMGMTKEAFASLIGISKSYLVLVEKGEKGLTVEKTVNIANATNTSTDFLLRNMNNSLFEFSKNNLNSFSDDEIATSFEVLKKLTLISKHK